LVHILDTVFAQRDLADWRTHLDAAGVTFGAVQSVNETADDAQMHQIGALVPFADGAGLTVSSPFQLEGETKVAPRRAPAIGEHTDVVLREAGYAPEEIQRLRALGVLA
jgi:formyl-CoA transferase